METYVDVLRIPVPGFRVRGKKYLTSEQVELLLSQEVVVEEKIDGTLLPGLPSGDHTVFQEDVQWCHTVHYSGLPAYLISFDVFDEKSQRFLGREEKEKFLNKVEIPCVPLLHQGKVEDVEFLFSFLGKPSTFGAPRIEGIVVKNYGLQLFGKIVDPQFEEEVDGSKHWRRKPRKLNLLRSN